MPEIPLTGWLQGKGWHYHPHQLAVLEKVQEGKDVLLCAPTGGGKTLSGFLPVFADLHARQYKHKGLHTLYISPLKALAVDIHRNLEQPINDLQLPITHETRTGDTPSARRVRQRKKPPHLLLTTPESLALMLSYPDAADYFASLCFVIIDEQHALMASKRGDLLALNLAVLKTVAPHVQFIGLSATIADQQDAANWLSRDNCAVISVPDRVKPDVHILLGQQKRMPWAGHMASYALPEVYDLVAKHRTSVVFVNTRAQAELMFQGLWRLNDKNLKIALHHGSLDRELRRKVEEKMATGELDCVVATASLDLGLDWANVDLVVQIGAPKGVSRLMQRIGRSNHRMDEPSKAILTPANRFEYLECLAATEAIDNGQLDGPDPRIGALDVMIQHMIGRACSAPFRPDDLYFEIRKAWPYRATPRDDFDRALAFVTDGGYALRSYDRFKRLIVDENGYYSIASKQFVQLYRMNIGTIVEAPMLKVKLRNKTLGSIEEWFIQGLTPGDTFMFGGEVLRFDGLKDMAVMASRTKDDSPQIPSYAGGRMPLSTYLSQRVRQMLADPAGWDHLPAIIGGWLKLQGKKSTIPTPDHMLVETFPRNGKYYTVAYPFEGRNAHQTLGFLVLRRLARMGAKPLGFVATDYAIAFWTLKPVKDYNTLFAADMLGDDLEEWLRDTPLLKRMFRDVAVITGLSERSHPGHRKTGRQMTFSTDLIYDVLRKYEPDHILLQAAYQDAAGGLIDLARLSALLARITDKIVVQKLETVSPLAVPLILEISRESVSRAERADYALEDIEQQLLEEAGLLSKEEAA